MAGGSEFALVKRCFEDMFGARLEPGFVHYRSAMRGHAHGRVRGAALGFRRAGEEPLFLEAYLDAPLEQAISKAFDRAVSRDRIVEIGNFAANSAIAMVELWATTANDLGADDEFAVATLTAPLRAMFARIGLPITVLADALPERLGRGAGDWGAYYDLDPKVCVGRIADGQQALARFVARRAGGSGE
jgi:hypothetical protein